MLLRSTIGIICWTEMVTISIVWIILSVYTCIRVLGILHCALTLKWTEFRSDLRV